MTPPSEVTLRLSREHAEAVTWLAGFAVRNLARHPANGAHKMTRLGNAVLALREEMTKQGLNCDLKSL